MDNRSSRSKGNLGPKPTQFKVRGDSRKNVKTPQMAPQPPPQPPQIHHQEPSQSRVPPRPVIRYNESPNIINVTTHADFKAVVQRLTGMPSTSTASSSVSTPSSEAFDASIGLVSPAARVESTEKPNTSNELGTFVGGVGTMDQQHQHHQHHPGPTSLTLTPPVQHYQQHQLHPIEQPSFDHGGILWPGPTSLPLTPPDFLSTVGPQGIPSNYTASPSYSTSSSAAFVGGLGTMFPSFDNAGILSSVPTSLPFTSIPWPPLPQQLQRQLQDPSIPWPLLRQSPVTIRNEPFRPPQLPQLPQHQLQDPSIPWPLHRQSPVTIRNEPFRPPPLPQLPQHQQQDSSIPWPLHRQSLVTFVGDVRTTDQYYYHQQHQHHPIERPNFHHAGNLSAEPTSMPLTSPDFVSAVGPTEPQGFSSFFSDDSNFVFPTNPSTIQSSSSMDDFIDLFDS